MKTPRTNALADRFGDIDPESPYWEALNLATELEKELRSDGPKQPAVDALKGVLDEIEDYLEQRQDVKDGSDGIPQANTEMNLLSDLKWWRDAAGMNSVFATSHRQEDK